MSSLIQGKSTAQNLAVKRFGYLISTLFMSASVVAMILESVLFPWLFLSTMYFLSGSLWVPSLIRPIYNLIGKRWPLLSKQEKQKSKAAYDSNKSAPEQSEKQN